VPATCPVTNPVAAFTVTALPLLLQVPPVGKEAHVSDSPTHKGLVPVINSGSGLTVIILVAKQPVAEIM
jgi:hypothetical protein